MSESDSSDSSSSESSSESSDCDEEDNEQGQEKMEGMLPEAPLPMEEVGWEKVLPTVCDSITPLKKTPPHFVAKTPQLSSVIPASFHLPTISPLAPDSPAHSQPSFTSILSSCSSSSPPKPPVSSFSGFGGFVLGANLLGGTQTSSEAENPSSSHSLDFLGSSANVTSGGVPVYSRASGEMKTTLLEAHTDSLGFSGVASLTSSSAPVFATSLETAAVGEASGSESDGEGAGGESGSESDDESSDGEEDSDGSSSSGDEGEEKINPTSQHPLLETVAAVPKSSVGSSVSSTAFFSGDDSFSFQGGGFFNDEDFHFLSRLQAGAENAEMDMDDVDALSHEPSASFVSELQPGSLDVQSNTDVEMGSEKPPPEVNVPPTQQERPVNLVSSDSALTSSTSNSRTQPQAGGVSMAGTSATAMVTPSRITTQLSVDGATSQTAGKKRKLERQSSLVTASDLVPLPPPARKTPRTTSAAPRVRRHSSLSSFSVSSDSSSSSSDSSGDEDSDADEDSKSRLSNSVVRLSSPQPSTLSHTSSSSTSGITSQNAPSLPPASGPLLANRRGSIVAPLQQGGLEAGELEEEEMEGEWTEGGRIESLLVKISLQTVDFQKEQKPKAKVGPYNVTAPSKPPRRRSTVDSSTHEDLSRLPGGHHGVDHDRGMYGRQRDRDDDHHGQYG
ncbi:hypothetical protein GBAR_LOCUS21789 [Geodia barretti]|uniref:Uncharacterized protein n=3 Tax=Geodia barretti TaxID=519541 RepID=A0AA35T0F6_GEOBA|nr:hypothetical protein GBAR_LOCUS21789 [Geodia barretti]